MSRSQVTAGWSVIASVIVIGLAVLALYWPVLDQELVGDDFQWLQLARAATRDHALLLADLDTFYRPSSTWTLAIDWIVWERRPLGYHLTNLALHIVAAALLCLVARRLGFGRWTVAIIGLLWAVSVFAEQPAAAVAIRFENLLFISWLALLLIWPSSGQSWGRWRIVAIATAVFLAIMSKETWVVTPVFVLTLEYLRQRRLSWRLLTPVIPVGAAVSAYVFAYFLAFPGGKSYFILDASTLLKVPHMIAAFCRFETLQPLAFRPTWTAAAAVMIVMLAMAWMVRKGHGAGIMGAVLLVAPLLPTWFVPYLPTRYTSIPYAGFLLLAAACFETGVGALAPIRRRIAIGGVGVAALLVLLVDMFSVRADLEDQSRVAAVTSDLLIEARRDLADLPADGVIVFSREEADNPLREIAATPRGLAKVWFPRHADPYALVDFGALLEWTREEHEIVVRRVGDWRAVLDRRPLTLVVHRRGSFFHQPVTAAQAAAVIEERRNNGRRVTVVETVVIYP